MRFQDWKNEKLQSAQVFTALESASQRDWDVGKILVRVRVNAWNDDIAIGISVSAWKPQDGCVTTLASGKRFDGGYFDLDYQRPLDNLTAAQLRIVAGLRAVVEEWVAGARSELPVQTPYEAIIDEMNAEAKSATAFITTV